MPDSSWTPSQDEIDIATHATSILFEVHGLDKCDPKMKRLFDEIVDLRSHDFAQSRFYSSALHRMTFNK